MDLVIRIDYTQEQCDDKQIRMRLIAIAKDYTICKQQLSDILVDCVDKNEVAINFGRTLTTRLLDWVNPPKPILTTLAAMLTRDQVLNSFAPLAIEKQRILERFETEPALADIDQEHMRQLALGNDVNMFLGLNESECGIDNTIQ